MPNATRNSHVSKVVAAAAAALLTATAAGCSEDTAGPETGADVEDVTEEDYFGSDDFVGETVTLSAEVTDVLSPRSFELAGDDWGDDSLLVLTQQQADVQEGDVIQVTGTVEEGFTYDDNVDPYALGDAGIYGAYDEENFLASATVDKTVETPN